MAAERRDPLHIGVLARRGNREIGQFAFARAFGQRALVQVGFARRRRRVGVSLLSSRKKTFEPSEVAA